MNNIANFHRTFKAIEDGIMSAYTVFSIGTSEVVKAFGSFTDVTKYNIELDIMSLMFGFLGIGLWSRGIF